MDYIVEVKNVRKKYKTAIALKDVTMNIRRGEIYGFVGENGAGKSTMIRVLTNVNRPTSGEVILNVEKRLGSIAALVETPALYQNQNAMNNLLFHADILGITKTKEELEEILHLVGLDDQIESHKLAKNYSLGMKQRLSIALILLSNPEFVLLDEPMNGLDPVGIKDMRDLILKLNKEHGTTFLISSHILSELDKIATTYGFISHGVLLEEISAKDLHEKAQSYGIVKLAAIDEKVLSLLHDFKPEVRENAIIISGHEEALKALQILGKNEIIVLDFETIRQTIEDYYLEVIKKGEDA